jgi:hypothetical protein
MLVAGKDAVSSLDIPIHLDEPLSPELALVSPELAERARRALPEPGWLAPIVRAEAPSRVTPLQSFVLALTAILLTVTPLALALLAQRSHMHH